MDKGSGALLNAARICLGLLAAAALLGAVVALAAGVVLAAVELIVLAAVLAIAAAYEHGRYQRTVKAGDAGHYERTDEVFTDPTTGQRTRVWYDQASGRRDYRPDA